MKWFAVGMLSTFLMLCLSGCWDQVPLEDRGFIMGVAIDDEEDGKIKLTSQVYRPVQTSGNQANREGAAYVNIQTTEETVFEAVRDIPIYLGRSSQWSHMRVILISREFAQKHDINDIFDFFIRDHEPRLTNKVLITEGKAADYFDVSPLIENTISQELRETLTSAADLSAKTIDMNLLDVILDLHSQTGNTVLPFVRRVETQLQGEVIVITGLAILKGGKMIDFLSSTDTKELMMLMDKYPGGVIKVPCIKQTEAKQENVETLEVIQAKTDIALDPYEDEVRGEIAINLELIVGELLCSDLRSDEEMQQFIETIRQTTTHRLQKVLKEIQKKKVDVLGVGNQLYAEDPRLWKRLKENWDEHFAQASLDIKVEITVSSTGLHNGKPIK